MTRSQSRTRPASPEIMAASPRGRFYPAPSAVSSSPGAVREEEGGADAAANHLRGGLAVTVRGDCYDVLDLYRGCVQRGETETPLCNAAVRSYLRCSASDK